MLLGDARADFAWLAGLLEAEGTFLEPTPSEPGMPIVACQMTDADIVQRVAYAFGTTVATVPRSGRRRSLYATRVKGGAAAALMQDLAPMMGERRSRAIEAALAAYSPPDRKLDFLAAEEIRERYASGESVSSLARGFAVARPTIRQVLERSIYRTRSDAPWREVPIGLDLADAARGLGIRPVELGWLAGWLEGEGSFLAPPPSDSRRVRISGVTTDADVAREVGRLLDVSPLRSHPARERRLGWSPTWRVLRRGTRAVALMRALYPLMGARRRAQIDSALAAVLTSVDGGEGNCTPVRGGVPMSSTSVPVGV
jgi:hypothetical protein